MCAFFLNKVQKKRIPANHNRLFQVEQVRNCNTKIKLNLKREAGTEALILPLQYRADMVLVSTLSIFSIDLATSNIQDELVLSRQNLIAAINMLKATLILKMNLKP